MLFIYFISFNMSQNMLENIQKYICKKNLSSSPFYTVFTILVYYCECSLCVSVCNSHLVNFVPLHPPAVTVAPSVTLHCARCPVGTAFIQHDRTSLCASFPLIVTLFYLVLLILSSSSCFYPHIATLCSLFFCCLQSTHFSLLPSVVTAVPSIAL